MDRGSSNFHVARVIVGVLVIGLLMTLLPAPNLERAAAIQPPANLRPIVEAVHHGGCQSQLLLLQSLAEQSGPLGARASYLSAHCLEQIGKTSEAQGAYDAAASRYPPLAPYARFAAARLALAAGQAADAAGRLEELGASPPSTVLGRRTRLLLAEALLNAGRPAEALKVLREVSRSLSDDESLTRAWWLEGMAHEKLGANAAARTAYTMAWWVVPENALAVQAMERVKTLSRGVLPDPHAAARLERGKRLAAVARVAEAERELSAALRQRPSDSIAAEAWYRLGLLRLSSKAGVFALQQALRYPENASRATFWLGEALTATGRSVEAKASWSRVSRSDPGSIWAARALQSLAISAEVEGNWPAADRILTELAARFPASRQGDEARWRRGWQRYRRGRYAEAEAVLLAAVQAAPSSVRAAESLYWASKAREQQRRDPRPLLSQVAQRYPLTYSGQRARVRLGAPAPSHNPAPAPVVIRSDQFYAVYEELAVLGFDKEAADEAEYVLESSSTATLRRFIAIHRVRAGDVAASVTVAEEAISPALHGGDRADVELWSLAYPRAYWDQVTAVAAKLGVDPYLVLAVMREESRFDSHAISPAGAVGLMQLMPYTARTLAGGEDVSTQRLMDPTFSIPNGASYLAGMLREFGGNIPLALAAYNAGPGAARRFARAARHDPDLFLATIPYAETRWYVRVVLETYGIYRWLYQ